MEAKAFLGDSVLLNEFSTDHGRIQFLEDPDGYRILRIFKLGSDERVSQDYRGSDLTGALDTFTSAIRLIL